MVTTITSVVHQPSGLYVVTDSAGAKYATKSMWLAALADRFCESQTPVEVFSGAGWHYRDLWSIRDPKQPEAPGAPARICAWCDTVLSEGTRPASHTMCPACLAKAEAELEAKAQ